MRHSTCQPRLESLIHQWVIALHIRGFPGTFLIARNDFCGEEEGMD